MRIGIALRDASSLSGVSRIVRASAKVLADKGHEVFVLTNRQPKIPWGLPSAVQWRAVPMLPFSSVGRAASFDFFCRREARRLGLDSLWGHGDLAAQDLLFVENCDAAYPERIGTDRRPSRGTRYIRARQFSEANTACVCAISGLVAGDVARFYGVPPERIRIIHHGVDGVEFNPGRKAARDAVRDRLGLARGAWVALSLISGDLRKRNIPALISAFHQARLPDSARLLLVGAGDGAGLGPRCVASGLTADVAELYGAADVFVLPALYEEFGLTVLEAMATGIPVLVSSSVGASELVTDGADGFLLRDARDSVGLVRLLETACAGADLKAMGERARKTALEHPWERMVQESLDFLTAARSPIFRKK